MDRGIKLYIDVVDSCNLTCPSCPCGNSKGYARRSGLMTKALLDEILAKAY